MTVPERGAYVRGYLAWPKGDPVFAGGRPWAGEREGCRNIAQGAYDIAMLGFPPVDECAATIARIEAARKRS